MKNKSFFVEYYSEERGETVIESDKGFITYKIYDSPNGPDKEIMICDFYVAPEFRGTKEARRLADEVSRIGRENNCTHLSCYIQHQRHVDQEIMERNRKRTTYKLKLFIHYGLVVHSMNEDQILMYKDL